MRSMKETEGVRAVVTLNEPYEVGYMVCWDEAVVASILAVHERECFLREASKWS